MSMDCAPEGEGGLRAAHMNCIQSLTGLRESEGSYCLGFVLCAQAAIYFVNKETRLLFHHAEATLVKPTRAGSFAHSHR